MSSLRQIKASAGSGKTWTLTSAYIDALLGSAGSTFGRGCSSQDAPYGINEILAITFTNAAAQEMRDRVIRRLKATALGLDKDASPEARRVARRWLNLILHDLNALNIRTIDSLLHMIVRSSLLQLGMAPDFEAVFESSDVTLPYIEKFLEEAAADPELRTLVANTIRRYARDFTGFGAWNRLVGKLKDVFEPAMLGRYKAASDPGEIERKLAQLQDEAARISAESSEWRADARKLQPPIQAAADNFLACLGATGQKALKKASLDRLQECASGQIPEKIPDGIADHELAALFKKTAKIDTTEFEPAFEGLYDAWRRYADRLAEIDSLLAKGRGSEIGEQIELLESGLKLAPFVTLANVMAESFRRDLSAREQLPSVIIPSLAASVLEPGEGVSDVLCRIGSRLNHFLIDEFQDTSREQWQVLQPLVMEALARGGSLTWVGDVKQSIYGWRNGDPRLFDDVAKDRDLRAIAPTFQPDRLEKNWRSGEVIVNFNNRLFGILEDQIEAANLVRDLLGKRLEEEDAIKTARAITAAYADCGQEPAGRASCPGFVQGEVIDADKSVLEAAVLSRLEELLREIHANHPWSDILVLIRANDDITEAAAHLLKAGIPVITEQNLILEADPVVAQILQAVRFVDNPEDNVAFANVLLGDAVRELCSLDEAAVNDWIAGARAAKDSPPLYQQFASEWPDLWRKIFEPFVYGSALMGPYDLVMEWASHLRLEERFPASQPFVRRFMETTLLAEEAGHSSTALFLEFWASHGERAKAPPPSGMDAIRLMTIHKAKGLQAPVCVVPWTDFCVSLNDSPVLRPFHDLMIPVAGNAKISGEHYAAEHSKQILESLNLLYVAFTRPQQELYFFVSDRKHGSKLAITRLVRKLLEHAGLGLPFSLGEPCKNPAYDAGGDSAIESAPSPEKTSQPVLAPEEDWRPLEWLSRLKIFRKKLDKEGFTPREKGILIHACLERIDFGVDPRQAALDALAFGMRQAEATPPAAEIPELLDSLAWFASLPQARDLLTHGWSEHPLMDENGDLLRTDLLVRTPSGALIIDYKTGKPDPENIAQVRRYMKCVSLSGQFGQQIQGLLIYLTQKKFMLVDMDSVSPLLDELP